MRSILLVLSLMLFMAGRGETPSAGDGVDLQEPPDQTEVSQQGDNGPAAGGGQAEKETVEEWDMVLANAEPYDPENETRMEPDTSSADTMGDILCDETLPDGTRIVCYWEPGSELSKYWAVYRDDDTLLRFCKEESGYTSDYTVEPFDDILGQSGFRLLAPRGAGYFAYDYYVVDGDGIPRLLARCANEVEETDLNHDGETDLRWYYHGRREIFTYFRQDGQLYLSSIDRASA